MSTSMREALDAAFKKQEEIGGSKEDTEESVRSPGEDEIEEEEAEQPEVKEKEEEGDDETAEDEAGSKEGDEGHKEESPDKGKKPDKPAKPEADKSGGKDGDGKKAKEPDAELKAPVSWKPAIREHWAKLPKEVKQEVLRRESEIEKGLHQASGFRKVANEYFNVVKPFEQLIRAQNSTPAKAITNLMTTAARLQTGTKAQKAQVVFEIIGNYDVDVATLDSILAGKAPKEGDDKVAKLLDERLKPITDFMTNVQTNRKQAEQKTDEEINTELETFAADAKNEFFNDVVDDMADIMDLAAKRGQKMALKDAYDRACMLNPEISKVINQREAARKGQLDAERLRKKKDASSSIKGSRGEDNDTKAPSADLRSAVAQAWAEAEEAR